MYLIDDYIEADSVDEAVNLLADNPERLIIAGGTDLLIKMRDGILENVQMVGIRRIEPLRKIEKDEQNVISIGAMATFNDLVRSELVQNNIPIMAEAAMTVGGPQIREMATVGGNLCNGMPSADSAPALLVLNARLKLLSKSGVRLAPLQEFYLRPGKVDLRPGELLTEILISKEDYLNFGGCYIKFAPRKAMDLAILGVAVTCRIRVTGIFDLVRIALGVAGPTPLRCEIAENFPPGKPVNDSIIAEIGRLAVKSSRARDSQRASKEFREHLVVELTQRALKSACNRAGGISYD
ncbi:MAG: xanthine dehydrogenase FAD-binding subunit XdhB [Firmicutes bacterium]|nr:xanthine dehydrogenase FAD-binding subunit XdhB [Bacillota bacterium]